MNEEQKELQKQIEEAGFLAELINQPGWKVLKENFEDKVSSLDTIREVNFKNFGIEEVMARQLAIGILDLWMADIELKAQSLEQLKKDMENLNKKSEIYKVRE